MKGGYKIIDFKHVPLSDTNHPALVPDLRAVLDENYGKAVLLTNVVLGEDSMDDCFSTVILKSNGRIKLNSYDGYITVDSDSYAHYTEGGSGDPTAEIEEIKEDIQDIQTDIGDLSELATEEKTSLVGSVNEVNSKVDDVSGDLGDIGDLETETKTSAVDAINELNTKLSKTEDLISNSGDAYSPSKPYKVGELCIYNNVLYRCTTACSAGSWATNQSCFTADTLTNVTGVIAKSLNRETIACGNAMLEVYGNVCILQINNANMPAEQSNFIPQGYRPHIQVWGAVSRVSASSSFISEARVSVYPDGKVSTQVNGSNVSVQIRGQLSWII